MSRILLVEDDLTLAMGIEYSLKNEGYNLDIARSFAEGKNLVDRGKYDLIILDISLPDGNGFDLCRYIRKNSMVPVIFLTAQDEEVNIVLGLDIGGDDYITKPFRIRELLSRIKAVLRRTVKMDQMECLVSKDIRVNLLESKIYKEGQVVWLTPSEYKLIVILMTNFHQVLPRVKILESLWDVDGDFVDDNSLSVYVRRLREKIEEDSSNPLYIKTVRGIGYTWDEEVRSE